MHNIVRTILDFIYPPSPEALLLRAEETQDFTRHYQPRKIKQTICLSRYQKPVIRAAVHLNKYHADKSATMLLAKLLETWLDHQTHPLTLVPIPLSTSRQRDRGYNQVQQILDQLPAEYRTTVKPLLCRAHNTAPQTKLDRKNRIANMTDAFTVRSRQCRALHKETVIIIDDVYTTGATMQAALTALRPHLPKTCSLQTVALAH